MTEEDAKELKKAFADLQMAFRELQEVVVQKDQRIKELESLLIREKLRNDELERRLAKDSHNSSKPPSSDGLKRKKKQREKSGKSSGGQVGHQGHALHQVELPKHIEIHRPSACEQCHHPLENAGGTVKERRQVFDLPPLELEVTEHRVVEMQCPSCQALMRGKFPQGVEAAAQYGPQIQALAVYLSQYQLLPYNRLAELFADLGGGSLSEGTLANWIREAANVLVLTQESITRHVLQSKICHVDETGVRIKGYLHWLHVIGTPWLTLYNWHQKRGKEAMDAIGVLPVFPGRLVHDRWSSYDRYDCLHSLCGAHLLRDCLFVFEQEEQVWAQGMHDLLLDMNEVVTFARSQGAKALPKTERERWLAQYFALLAQGYAIWNQDHPPLDASLPAKRGRRKQSAAKNLLDVFLLRAEEVLAFFDDFSVPFTNNRAERDLRMVKVQQKISGTFRSSQGATAFCVIRSYLSTMRKQGRSMLAAMAAVFAGSPFPVAWGSM